MFVQMKWHKSSPDGQAVEFALVGPRLDQDRVEIASLLNSYTHPNREKGRNNFILHMRSTIRFHYSWKFLPTEFVDTKDVKRRAFHSLKKGGKW